MERGRGGSLGGSGTTRDSETNTGEPEALTSNEGTQRRGSWRSVQEERAPPALRRPPRPRRRRASSRWRCNAPAALAGLASTAMTRSPAATASSCATWPLPLPTSITHVAPLSAAARRTAAAMRGTSCAFLAVVPTSSKWPSGCAQPRRLTAVVEKKPWSASSSLEPLPRQRERWRPLSQPSRPH